MHGSGPELPCQLMVDIQQDKTHYHINTTIIDHCVVIPSAFVSASQILQDQLSPKTVDFFKSYQYKSASLGVMRLKANHFLITRN